MGFGLIFFGYAMAYLLSLNSFGFLFRLLGCAIMISGLSKLTQFEKSFKYANAFVYMLSAAATAESIIYLFGAGLAEKAQTYSLVAFLALSIPFHVFLHRSINSLSKDVGLLSILKSSMRNAAFGIVELVLATVAFVFWYLKVSVARYLLMAAFILPFLIFVLNLILLYSCYKNICEEGDEEALRKPSKISFLNKLFDAADKREQEIFEKTKSYAESKIKQDNEKKKIKKKNKKKNRR